MIGLGQKKDLDREIKRKNINPVDITLVKNTILTRVGLMTEIINFVTMSIANEADHDKKIIIKQLM